MKEYQEIRALHKIKIMLRLKIKFDVRGAIKKNPSPII